MTCPRALRIGNMTAATKSVVALAFVSNNQPGFDHLRVVVIVEGGPQRLPSVRRVTQRKSRGGLTRNAASLQIVDRSATVFELAAIKVIARDRTSVSARVFECESAARSVSGTCMPAT